MPKTIMYKFIGLFLLLLAFTAHAGTSPTPNFNVTLINGLSGQAIANQEITAKKIVGDSYKWIASDTTDSNGSVSFYLDGLGGGSQYKLYTKAYSDFPAWSDLISNPGNYLFKVGMIPVKVVAGGTNAPLPNHEITVKEEQNDGSWKWFAQATTNQNGLITIDLPGIENGRIFKLSARSPWDDSYKYSDPITSNGPMTFTVGNAPLRVKLIDYHTGVALSGIDITAKEKLQDGSFRWVSGHTTDNNGNTIFDLDELGKGRTYILRTEPYNGGSVYSIDIRQPGAFTFNVGILPVKLTDKRYNHPLANIKLTLLEKRPDGKLNWYKSGTTDAKGMVYFDPNGLPAAGSVFVVKAESPFGEGKRYYSKWVTQPEILSFAITRGEEYSLDLTPPWIVIDTPQANAEIANKGFLLRGRSNDDRQLAHITANLITPAGKRLSKTVKPNDNGDWLLNVPADFLSGAEGVTAHVHVFDSAFNMASQSIHLKVIADSTPPELEITSHNTGDSVHAFNVLVAGRVTDNAGLFKLTGTVTDPKLGTSIDQKLIAISPSTGRWVLPIPANKITLGNSITVRIEATDTSGNRSSNSLSLKVVRNNINPDQLLSRTSFGTTPAMIAKIDRVGPDAYLAQQLNPASIPDTAFKQLIQGWIPEEKRDIDLYQLIYSIYSDKQLLEVMTWFWDNHFNTDINKTYHVEYELNENRAFRNNAFGYFRNLLQISATSPAMMIYLDNHSSRKEDPNENYARELLELHTMGVDGGYTQHDIGEIARIFSGWRVKDEQFHFEAYKHDDDSKIVLGHTIPGGGGMKEGEMVLDILATHPSTATHICTKLLQLFVSDNPADNTINSCRDVFLGSNGHIRTVLKHILYSADFSAPENFHTKVKNPLEFLSSIIRNFQAKSGIKDLRYGIESMGMPPFENAIPTGWPETGEKWANSNQLMMRFQFHSDAIFNENDPEWRYTSMEPKRLLANRNLKNADEVLSYLFRLAMANDYSELEWDTAYSLLTDNSTRPFDLNQPDADQRLRNLINIMLTFPGYQLQ